MAPFDVYFDNKNVFQPDIILVLNENLSHLKENGYYVAPDSAIEILSPRTNKYDPEDKMEVYAKYGVKEYWVTDPHEKRAIGNWLVNDEYHSFTEAIGVLNSQLLNKKFKF
jgi:Uma2 family endonuclease